MEIRLLACLLLMNVLMIVYLEIGFSGLSSSIGRVHSLLARWRHWPL